MRARSTEPAKENAYIGAIKFHITNAIIHRRHLLHWRGSCSKVNAHDGTWDMYVGKSVSKDRLPHL